MILHGVAPPLSRADPAKSGNLMTLPRPGYLQQTALAVSAIASQNISLQLKAQASLITTNDERPFLRGFVDKGILKNLFSRMVAFKSIVYATSAVNTDLYIFSSSPRDPRHYMLDYLSPKFKMQPTPY